MKSNILSIKHISKTYGKQRVVNDISLNIAEGEFITILGPSGCGKTTTLRMIGGFETPDKGSISLFNEDITLMPPYQRNVNTVFQNYALFPNMNVFENIAFGLKQKKWSKENIEKKVNQMLEVVRMEKFAKRKPFELSGGQQQRIAIARAIANDPHILLLDEPLGALDLKLRKEMQFELKQLHEHLNKTFIYVTHDQEEALTLSDRIIIMNNGIIEQEGTQQEIYFKPQNAFVANFIGEINTFNLSDWNTIWIDKTKINKSTHQKIYIRPENIHITSQDKGILEARLIKCIFFGSKWKCIFECEDKQQFFLYTSNMEQINEGDIKQIMIDKSSILIF